MDKLSPVMDDPRRKDNIRTGIILALLAAASFFGFFAKVYFFR